MTLRNHRGSVTTDVNHPFREYVSDGTARALANECPRRLGAWLGGVAGSRGCPCGRRGGHGQTVLLQEFSHAATRGAGVLWGACGMRSSHPGLLAPLHDIARQTKGALFAAINAEDSARKSLPQRLDEMEPVGGVGCAFEDIHWADEKAQLDLIQYLGRRIPCTHWYAAACPSRRRSLAAGIRFGLALGDLLSTWPLYRMEHCRHLQNPPGGLCKKLRGKASLQRLPASPAATVLRHRSTCYSASAQFRFRCAMPCSRTSQLSPAFTGTRGSSCALFPAGRKCLCWSRLAARA